jgi:hypothetical protein
VDIAEEAATIAPVATIADAVGKSCGVHVLRTENVVWMPGDGSPVDQVPP